MARRRTVAALLTRSFAVSAVGPLLSPPPRSHVPCVEALPFATLYQESTKDAEVIAATKRLGHGGLPVYEFEYTVDSTRGGMKRIFSAAFVASKKLYLLNIAYSDRPENPLDSQTRMVLEEILHSFDTAS